MAEIWTGYPLNKSLKYYCCINLLSFCNAMCEVSYMYCNLIIINTSPTFMPDVLDILITDMLQHIQTHTGLFFIIHSSYWFNIYTAIWICFVNSGYTMRIVSVYLNIFILFMNQEYFDLYTHSEGCFMDIQYQTRLKT